MGKLHDQMTGDLILKAYSPHTQSAYLRCARHFVRHYMRSPQEMGEQEVRDFLLHLVRDRNASPATQDMYVNALKFLYTITLKRPEVVKDLSHPKRPKTLPVILSPEEVLRIFAAIRSVKYKAIIIAAAYAAGLRISEVCSLSVADIDSQRMRLHIRSGKVKKDRYVMLGESLLALLRQYYQAVRPQGEYLFPGQKPQSHISTTAVSLAEGQVIFRARDNSRPGQKRLVTTTAQEFIRRFLLHVLPPRFVKIRHYGLMAPCNAKTKLEKARVLLSLQVPGAIDEPKGQKLQIPSETKTWQEMLQALTGLDLTTCPQCGQGRLIRCRLIGSEATLAPTIWDSS